MSAAALLASWIVVSLPGVHTPEAVKTKQDETFQRYWNRDFEWKFAELPDSGAVPKQRQPYSGYIYPDRAGGTIAALHKYDAAFNGHRSLAAAYEQHDTTAYKKLGTGGRGLAGLIGGLVPRTPAWHGHCNGWSAAAIRHAEPKRGVRYNGVEFAPSDIKALLAELYIYNDFMHLAGQEHKIDAGAFHAIIANWLGRAEHPIGMEADPGEEKWNYPIFSYSSSSAKRGNNVMEVRLNLAYTLDAGMEYDEAPREWRYKEFHYLLQLNSQGKIVGGQFLRDSDEIDMLWIPLCPKPAGQDGNRMGNPYISVDRILALWRASVPAEERQAWLTIDPAPKDRLTSTEDIDAAMIPVQVVGETLVATPESGDTDPDGADEQPTVAAQPEVIIEPIEESQPEPELAPEPATPDDRVA